MGYSFRLAARVLLYPSYHRTTHTTAFVTPVVELNGSTMKVSSDDPSHHERTLLPRSYISLPFNTYHSLCYTSCEKLAATKKQLKHGINLTTY